MCETVSYLGREFFILVGNIFLANLWLLAFSDGLFCVFWLQQAAAMDVCLYHGYGADTVLGVSSQQHSGRCAAKQSFIPFPVS